MRAFPCPSVPTHATTICRTVRTPSTVPVCRCRFNHKFHYLYSGHRKGPSWIVEMTELESSPPPPTLCLLLNSLQSSINKPKGLIRVHGVVVITKIRVDRMARQLEQRDGNVRMYASGGEIKAVGSMEGWIYKAPLRALNIVKKCRGNRCTV